MANPTIENTKILYYGTQANYEALETKDASILYFCTDSKKIYKGSIEMTEQIIVAATKPETGIVTGKLYVIQNTGTVEFYNGTTWTVVSYPIVKSVTGGGAGISVASTDVQVPSAKAVYDYVQGIIGGDDVVTEVEASTTDDATIVVTKGDGSTSPVVVPGVILAPSWDAQTRTITFPVSDDAQNPVTVEIGKDVFIDPTAENRYENGNIYLYLNDGTQTKDPTEIVIPVTALVTDYFGDSTDTVAVTIDNTTHKVTADVRVRPDGDGFSNLLKVNSVTGAEGLYVDRTAIDANTAAITTLNGDSTVTGSVDQKVSVVAADVAANTAAITTLNGDATVTGSVDQKVSVVAADVATNTAAIATLNGDASTTGSVAHAVAAVESEVTDLETNKVDVNAANIAVLASAQGWGTF